MSTNKNTTKEATDNVGKIVEDVAGPEAKPYREHDRAKLNQNDMDRLATAYIITAKINQESVENATGIVMDGVEQQMQTRAGEIAAENLKETLTSVKNNSSPKEVLENYYKGVTEQKHKLGMLGKLAKESYYNDLNAKATEFADGIIDYATGKSDVAPGNLAGKETEIEFAAEATKGEIKEISLTKELSETLNTYKEKGESFIKGVAENLKNIKEQVMDLAALPSIKQNKDLEKDVLEMSHLIEEAFSATIDKDLKKEQDLSKPQEKKVGISDM